MIHDDKPDLADVIEHYGVKGMKWGVRKDRQPRSRAGKIKKYDKEMIEKHGKKKWRSTEEGRSYGAARKQIRRDRAYKTIVLGAAAAFAVSQAQPSNTSRSRRTKKGSDYIAFYDSTYGTVLLPNP